MASNIEVILVRVSDIIENKYQDKELSQYLKSLNTLFLQHGYPKKTDNLAREIVHELHKKYLKEWK